MAKLMRRWTDMNGRPQPNLWLGVSVEDQASADERIPLLLETPAAVRWISAEPLLGPVSLDCWPIFGEDDKPMLNWIVAGGESGPHARPMHPDWVRSLRDQCAAAGVPFLFKQWGEHDLSYDRDRDDPDCRDCGRMDRLPGRWINLAAGHGFHGERVHYAHRVGKKAAGRLLDGVAHDGYPE
jgi:protein gp37